MLIREHLVRLSFNNLLCWLSHLYFSTIYSNRTPATVPARSNFFLNSHSGGWIPNWVRSARRPLNGLLYLPRLIMMMENLVEWRLAGETEVLGENLPQRHFVHGLRHELSSLARTLGSWVRISSKAWMFGVCMRLLCVSVALCLGRGLATGWSLVQGVLPSVKNDYGTE
jgi:hypothetical protein